MQGKFKLYDKVWKVVIDYGSLISIRTTSITEIDDDFEVADWVRYCTVAADDEVTTKDEIVHYGDLKGLECLVDRVIIEARNNVQEQVCIVNAKAKKLIEEYKERLCENEQ